MLDTSAAKLTYVVQKPDQTVQRRHADQTQTESFMKMRVAANVRRSEKLHEMKDLLKEVVAFADSKMWRNGDRLSAPDTI